MGKELPQSSATDEEPSTSQESASAIVTVSVDDHDSSISPSLQTNNDNKEVSEKPKRPARRNKPSKNVATTANESTQCPIKDIKFKINEVKKKFAKFNFSEPGTSSNRNHRFISTSDEYNCRKDALKSNERDRNCSEPSGSSTPSKCFVQENQIEEPQSSSSTSTTCEAAVPRKKIFRTQAAGLTMKFKEPDHPGFVSISMEDCPTPNQVKRKPRSYSETNSRHARDRNYADEAHFKKPSLSFGRNRQSDWDRKFCEESSTAERKSQKNSEILGNSSKNRRGKRGKKVKNNLQNTSDDISKFIYDIESKNLQLNAETFLILDLLSMPADERENFLFSIAEKRKILVKNPITQNLDLHPRIVDLKSKIFCLGKNAYAFDNENRNHLVSNLRKKSATTEKKEKKSKNKFFEDYVTAIVQQDLPEDKKKEFEFTRYPKSKRVINYYDTPDFNDELEKFAQRCVEANLGRIIEADVRINARNNGQAFMKCDGSETDAMLHSFMIRKCALQGDIVRAFVRNKAVDPATVCKNEDTELEKPKEDEAATCNLPADDNMADAVIINNQNIAQAMEEEESAAKRCFPAFVIKIVQKVHPRRFVGCFLSRRIDSDSITFVPRDMKLPNLKIMKENWPETFVEGKMEMINDTLYVAEMIDWQDLTCYGRILQPIGKCGELESENKAILLQNHLSMDPFDKKFNRIYEEPFIITEDEIEKREDLRDECIFTIDPLTARDLDDALSCKTLEDGNFEIGVHISDVSYFLHEETELDQLVKLRTTSVYLVNEVFHMLPKPLCYKCSLLPGADKLTFSVIWSITPNAEILHTRFTRSVINSCTQFAYEHAQKIIEYPERDFTENDFPQIFNGHSVIAVVEKIKSLHSIAAIMREKRFENGALKIDKPKLSFELNPENGEPESFGIQKMDTANFMIEEFMLQANQSVAKFIYENYPKISILRNHLPPFKQSMKMLKDRLTKLDINLDIRSSKTIYESMKQIIMKSENPHSMSICLSVLISKPMTRARYFCSYESEDPKHFWHYALSIPIYTHFTSPIRRYPDIMVHRLLSAALGYTSAPVRTPDELHAITAICNEKKYNARLAGEDSCNLYFMHYINSKNYLVMQASVSEIFQVGIETVLIETGHTVRISNRDCGKGVNMQTDVKSIPKSAKVTFTAANTEPLELKTFSEVWLEIRAEKKSLKATILSGPSIDER